MLSETFLATGVVRATWSLDSLQRHFSIPTVGTSHAIGTARYPEFNGVSIWSVWPTLTSFSHVDHAPSEYPGALEHWN